MRERPYRSCRNSSVMENSLVSSCVTRARKLREPSKSSNLNRNKRGYSEKRNHIKKTINNAVFKKLPTPKKKQIQHIINTLREIRIKRVTASDCNSSGYCSDESRGCSVNLEVTAIGNRSKGVVDVPNSSKDNEITWKCIRAYLKITQYNVDLDLMTMLVQLIETITEIKLRRYILGMRILECLNRMDDGKYEQLVNDVKREVSKLSPFVHMDLIKVYIEYVLYMFELRRKC